jgi:hypothetical protein
MWSHSWPDFLKSDPPRQRTKSGRTCRRCRAAPKPFLEPLEDRSLPSVSPIPIPGQPGFHRDGGPDIHFQLPGPADNTNTGRVGGEPSTITDFNGFIGVAHVQGTGTDNQGNTLFWDTDLRFMHGVFQGDDGSIHQGTFAFV